VGKVYVFGRTQQMYGPSPNVQINLVLSQDTVEGLHDMRATLDMFTGLLVWPSYGLVAVPWPCHRRTRCGQVCSSSEQELIQDPIPAV